MKDRQLIFSEIEAERQVQDREHGGPSHDDTHTCNDKTLQLSVSS